MPGDPNTVMRSEAPADAGPGYSLLWSVRLATLSLHDRRQLRQPHLYIQLPHPAVDVCCLRRSATRRSAKSIWITFVRRSCSRNSRMTTDE